MMIRDGKFRCLEYLEYKCDIDQMLHCDRDGKNLMEDVSAETWLDEGEEDIKSFSYKRKHTFETD